MAHRRRRMTVSAGMLITVFVGWYYCVAQIKTQNIVPTRAPQVVELRNPSFEEIDAAGNPIGWTFTSPATSTSGVKIEVDPRDGRFAARLFTKVPTTIGAAPIGFYQEVRAQPRSVYTISAFVKVLSLSDPDALQLFIVFIPSGKEIVLSLVEASQNIGIYQSIARNVQAPDEASSMRLGFRIKPNTTADALIDEVRLFELPYQEPISTVPATQPTIPPAVTTITEETMELFGSSYFANPNVLLPPLTTVPPAYRIGVGDVIELRYWSPVMLPEVVNLEVDPEGNVQLPAGRKITAAGLTIREFENEARRTLGKLFVGIEVSARLAKLRSIQINVTGEVVRPGPYLMSPLSTVFNALAMAGGVSRRGSFRKIRLIRGGKVAKTIDFYDFLLKGDKSGDVPLEEGDVVHIPVVGPTVIVKGEVKRPAIYEIIGGERLRDIIELAGGVLPSAYLGRVRVHRIINNQRKLIQDILVSELFTNPKPEQNVLMQDGDEVVVLQVLPEKRRIVSISGAINRPGVYEWYEGMKVKDLIERAEGLPPDRAYKKRAEVFRDNGNGLRQIIAFDLEAALNGDGNANLELKERDEIIIYSFEQAKLTPQVTIIGAVRRPGVYEYTEGLTLKDFIFRVGGALPNAYLKRAELKRDNGNGVRQIIPIDLEALERGDGASNIPLMPRDEVVVYSYDEVRLPPQVQIRGAVRRPGTYEYTQGLTIKDLIFASGGTLPNAYLKRAELIRYVTNEQRILIPIDLERVRDDDTSQNIPLQERDELIIYATDEVLLPRQVVVRGAVRRPGIFERDEGMRISDLIFRAGVLPQAYLKCAWLIREDADGKKRLITIDLEKAQQNDPAHNIFLQDRDELLIYSIDDVFLPRIVKIIGQVRKPGEYARRENIRVTDLIIEAGGLTFDAYKKRAHLIRYLENGRTKLIEINLERALDGDPEHNLLLQDRDELRIYSLREQEPERQDQFVTISGAVQRPGIYPLTEGMSIKDLIYLAGGLLPNAHKVAEIGRPMGEKGTEILYVDLEKLLDEGDESHNMRLQNNDRINIKLVKEYVRTVRTVKITGEVKYPGVYAIRRGETLYQLIQRAGGLTEVAFPDGVIFRRQRDVIISPHQQEVTKRLIASINRYNYQKFASFLAAHGVKAEEVLKGIPTIMPAQSGQEIEGRAAVAAAQAVAEAIVEATKPGEAIAAPPMPLTAAVPSGRVIVNLPLILVTNGKEGDIVLEDGDEIYIPQRPTTVTISGAVFLPSSVTFVPNKTVRYYLNQVGGLTRDADTERIFIVKANGSVVRAKMSTVISAGDHIVVPPRVIIYKESPKTSEIFRQVFANLLGIGLILLVR
ncbi:MAG: SLBB domain-containing protein [Armatimonadota bacterium]|nr:SLBB domain-containing protein [Armatimonadota bacterium]MCX7778264.1 SLBB domain-containing protein [Armatimonadota bacterium]MDW8026293.1 SLBB domain-containing protein [Armatimonadota bacterium]